MSLYLLIDLASVFVPFLFSFHPRIAFVKQWRYALPAIALTAIPFLIWDQWFTTIGVWGFNPVYHGSTMVGAMPLEEVLFFICIPYACLFTYWSIRHLTSISLPKSALMPLYGVLFVVFTLMGVLGREQWYTCINGVFAFAVLLSTAFVKRDLMLRFFPVYLVTLIPFFIVNGILTGTGLPEPIVWYNNAENMGIRALTIPIEDFAYSFSMLLLPTLLFEVLKERAESRSTRQ
jgi:lycopene cyclase domain-containing protein